MNLADLPEATSPNTPAECATAPVSLDSLIETWPGRHVLAIADRDKLIGLAGDANWVTAIASISKLFSTYAVLVAVEEGSVALDDPAGPPGSTLAHLLAHCSGYGFNDSGVRASPAHRRIYSNVGIEAAAEHVATRVAMPFSEYLREAVTDPLGLTGPNGGPHPMLLSGSPAYGFRASVNHLITFAREVLSPKLLHTSTVKQACSPQWPQLRGVLPGYGRQDPNMWGFGFEIHAQKSPHWMSPLHSAECFGHFGGAGSFLWMEPATGLIGASIGNIKFGEWAVPRWAAANTELLERFGSGNSCVKPASDETGS